MSSKLNLATPVYQHTSLYFTTFISIDGDIEWSDQLAEKTMKAIKNVRKLIKCDSDAKYTNMLVFDQNWVYGFEN